MDPISSQQFSRGGGDPTPQRMRRLLQSAALAALAIGFATAMPVSLNSPATLSMAFADSGEGGEGGGGETGGGEGGGGESGDHDGDHEGGNSGPGSDHSGPGHGGDDHHEAGDDEHGDDHEAGDDEHGDDHEAGDDEAGDDEHGGVIVPGDDDGTPDQGPGDAPGTETPGDDDGTPDQGSGDAPTQYQKSAKAAAPLRRGRGEQPPQCHELPPFPPLSWLWHNGSAATGHGSVARFHFKPLTAYRSLP